MFFQNYENQIFPYDFDLKREFRVSLHGEVDKEPDVIEFLSKICSGRRYRGGGNLQDVACGAVETICKELIRNGVASYRLSVSDTHLTLPTKA